MPALPAAPPATLGAFEQVLAAQDSATAALGQWCAARGLAGGAPPVIRAEQLAGPAPAPPPALRRWLGLKPDAPLAYRHVRLWCGGVVLSEAHNWYDPARLTPAMNAALATTDTPFGKVVAPLHFTRQRLAAQEAAAAPCPAGTILTHRARLVLPDGAPLAALVECYTPANLGG